MSIMTGNHIYCLVLEWLLFHGAKPLPCKSAP